MSASDGYEAFFLAVATVAIAITGFAGIVARFDSQPWPAYHRAGLQAIIDPSLGAALLCLLPSAIRIGDSTKPVWLISSLAAIVVMLMEVIFHLYRLRKCSKAKQPPRHPTIVWSVLIATLCVVVLMCGLLYTGGAHAGLVVLAVMWLLFVACLQLWFFLLAEQPVQLPEKHP